VSEHEQLAEQPTATLRCVECAATTTDGYRWRAYLAVGDEDVENEEAVAVYVYCPACSARTAPEDVKTLAATIHAPKTTPAMMKTPKRSMGAPATRKQRKAAISRRTYQSGGFCPT